MYYTIAEFKFEPSRLPDILEFVAEVKDEVRRMGAVHSHLVNLGAGTAANISMYPDRATALSAFVNSKPLYEHAVREKLIRFGTLRRRAGGVIFDYLGHDEEDLPTTAGSFDTPEAMLARSA